MGRWEPFRSLPEDTTYMVTAFMIVGAKSRCLEEALDSSQVSDSMGFVVTSYAPNVCVHVLSGMRAHAPHGCTLQEE